MTNSLKIIALSVDSRNLTLWDEQGNTTLIKQGDIRVARIVDEARSLGLAPGNPVTIDLTLPANRAQEYNDVEKGTGGVVKFFRVAKAKLKAFLMDDSEPNVRIIPDMFLGSTNLIGNAMDKFLNVREATPGYEHPEPTVDTDHGWGDYNVVLRGFNKDHNRVALVKVIREIVGCSLEKALEAANGPMPAILRAGCSEANAKEYASQLAQIKGVFAVAAPYDQIVYAYVEDVKATNEQKLDAASEKLTALGAIGTEADEFHTELKEEETVVAVVGDKVIPDVQNLQRQIRQSAKLNDYKGFTRFLERLATVIDARKHSVEDLMKFMEKGDLPIADDGSIVIYKRLNKVTNGKYVDCHSGKIEQWVGCKVSVKDELVDPDRRRDCSNGLHVASLSYLSSFGGNVTIIGKVAPEDVFAVPEYNTNKMRVSAYHIVAELTPAQRDKVNNGGSISSVEGGTELLNQVLTGQHDAPSTLVTVGGHYGTNLTYSSLNGAADNADPVSKVVKNKTTIDLNEDLTKAANTAAPVTAQDIKPVAPAKKTNMDIVKELWEKFQKAETSQVAADVASELIALKGKMKKPWSVLGLTSEQVQQLADARTQMPVERAKAEPVKTVKINPAKKGSSKIGDIIRGYLSDAGMSEYSKAHAIHDLKRAAKKSYAALGLTEDEIKAIDKLKHHL